jgi:predicted MPP superfamily phosphohydrolase
LGTLAINGNHDWWADWRSQATRDRPPEMQRALEDAGIEVLANKAVRRVKDGKPFWISGTDSIIAYFNNGNFIGRDNLPATLAQITDEAPVIHMAHEPDLFVQMPDRVSVTLSGHTHGGQIRIAGYSPWVPSAFARRFLYGHIIEQGRHLIVSGGLGCSTLPVRLGSPPEINLLELG